MSSSASFFSSSSSSSSLPGKLVRTLAGSRRLQTGLPGTLVDQLDPLLHPLRRLLRLLQLPLLLLLLFLQHRGLGQEKRERSGVHTIRSRGRQSWRSHRRHRSSHVTDRDCRLHWRRWLLEATRAHTWARSVLSPWSFVHNLCPSPQQWCKATASSAATIIRSCRQHERSRHSLQRRALRTPPKSRSPDMATAGVRNTLRKMATFEWKRLVVVVVRTRVYDVCVSPNAPTKHASNSGGRTPGSQDSRRPRRPRHPFPALMPGVNPGPVPVHRALPRTKNTLHLSLNTTGMSTTRSKKRAATLGSRLSPKTAHELQDLRVQVHLHGETQ